MAFNCTEEINDCEIQQFSLEQLFRKLLRKTGNCIGLSVSGTFAPSSSVRTPSRSSKSAGSYSTTAGARAITFETDSSFSGTILGVAAQPDRIYEFKVNQNNDFLASIAYVVTTGNVIVGELN